MSYVTDAARAINYKQEYQEYLALMQKAAKVVEDYDRVEHNPDIGKKTWNDALNKLWNIFEEIERKFTGPHSAPSANHILRHDYEIDEPMITLSFDSFVNARKEYEEMNYADLYKD